MGPVQLPLLDGKTLRSRINGVEVIVIDAQQYNLQMQLTYHPEGFRHAPAAIAKDNDAGIDILFHTCQYLQFLMETAGRMNVVESDILVSIYNFTEKIDNAFFNGYYMTYGSGKQIMNALVSADVIAHELTHGLVRSIAGKLVSKHKKNG